MARLNEPPVAPGPSAETIDVGESAPRAQMSSWMRIADKRIVVKRRFLRQNRELAKSVAISLGYVGLFADEMEIG